MRARRVICGLASFAIAIGAIRALSQEPETASDVGFELADGSVSNDPADAFATEVAATLAGAPRVQQLRSLVERWAARDPKEAALAVEALPSTTAWREGLAEIAGRHWSAQDPDAAISWATRLNDAGAWSGVLVGLAARDPVLALTVASGMPGRGREEYVNVVIAAIAADDPAAAAAHWQHAGLAEMSPYTANRIAQHWVARDLNAVEQWALGLPAGNGRDIALTTILALATLDAARAAALVNRIDAEQSRTAAARLWMQSALDRRDPTVTDFDSRLALSPAARAKLEVDLRR